MKTILLKYFTYFVNLGIRHDFKEKEIVWIRFVNISAMVLAISISLSLVFLPFFNEEFPYKFIPLFFIGPIVLGCNYKQLYNSAKVFLCVLLPINQLLNVVLSSGVDGIEYTVLPFLVLVFAIFDYKNPLKYILSVFIMTIMITVLYINYDGDFGPNSFNISVIGIVFILMVEVIKGEFFKYLKKVEQNNRILEEQNQKLEKLNQQNELKTELLSIIAHDLQGPSTAFDELTDKVSFLIKKEKYEELQSIGHYFEESSKKLFGNLNHMLNWSMAQKTQIKPVFGLVSIRSIIRNIIISLEIQHNCDDINILCHVSRDLVLYTDEMIVNIILTNLLENAFKYTKEGGDIIISYKEELGSYNQIIIENTGDPINLDRIKGIEKGIYQKSKNGYGLGVGICFLLVEALNGELAYEALDYGTRAILNLPISDQKSKPFVRESKISQPKLINAKQ